MEAPYHISWQSPVGWLALRAGEEGLRSIAFTDDEPPAYMGEEPLPDFMEAAIIQLKAWFSGKLLKFDLPLDEVGTPFQKKVWEQVREIPFGHTISYGALARQLGDIKAVRAVAAANGANPLALITPCHRVIGSDGSLTGYAWGLERKEKLLDLERPYKQTSLF